MLRLIIFLISLGSAVAAELETFELTDGRTLVGTYDDQGEKLKMKDGTNQIILSISARNIVSRTPFVSPDDIARKKEIKDKSEAKLREADESRAKWAKEAQDRINAKKEKEAQEKADLAAKAVAKAGVEKAAAVAEEQRGREAESRKEVALQRAAFWKERGFDFDAKVLTSGEMDERVQAKIDENEAKRSAKEKTEKKERQQKEEGLNVRNALDKIARSIRVELLELHIEIGDVPIYIGMEQPKVTELINPNNTGRQKESQWCWAACVQMICASQGISYPQEEVVRIAKGRKVNLGGTFLDFLKALSEEGSQENGQPIQLSPKFTTTVPDILNDLNKKFPLIGVFVVPGERVGHAMVITGTSLVFDKQMKMDYEKSQVCLFDPWPDSPAYQEMSMMNFIILMEYAVRLRITKW